MRADRLVATVLLLQSRGRVTAGELAAELEVSTATARRDLEALSAAGVPVYPQPGRGGGWSLVGGARTDLSGLTAPEARALFLLVGPAAAVAPEAKAALRKLVRALPGPFRADAEAASEAVVIDPAAWGGSQRRRPVLAKLLQQAVVERRQVRLTYTGRSGAVSTRMVDPYGLVDKDEVWYLVAGTEAGQRTFRVDRISEVNVTDRPTARPADFVLSEAWDEVVEKIERRRSLAEATVLIDPRFVPVLRDHFGRHCTVEDGSASADVDRVRVRVAADTPLSIAEKLAGWGERIEVIDTPLVRAELARIGTELVARHQKR